MARALTRIKHRKAETFGGGNREPERELTLEEAREKYAVGTEELLVAELRGLAAEKEIQKEALNGYNRQKTRAGKAFIAYMLANDIEPGKAEVQVGEVGYGYDYSSGETIDPEKLFGLFEKKKITREQFLKSISVPKDAAKRNIGDHILITIIGDKQGKTLDIRTRELDLPAKVPTVVRNGMKPKPAGRIKRTNVEKPGSAVRAPAKRIRRQRIIR